MAPLDGSYRNSRFSAKLKRILHDYNCKHSYQSIAILYFIDRLENVSKCEGRPVCVTLERGDTILSTLPNEADKTGSVSFSGQCLKLNANVPIKYVKEEKDIYPTTNVRFKVRKYNMGGSIIGRYVLDMANIVSNCKSKLSKFCFEMDSGIIIFLDISAIPIAVTARTGNKNAQLLNVFYNNHYKQIKPQLVGVSDQNIEESLSVSENKTEQENVSDGKSQESQARKTERTREIPKPVQKVFHDTSIDRMRSEDEDLFKNEKHIEKTFQSKEEDITAKESKQRWKDRTRKEIGEMKNNSEKKKERFRKEQIKLLAAELESQLFSAKLKFLELDGETESSKKLDEAYEKLIKIRACTAKNSTETVQLQMELEECEQELLEMEQRLKAI